MKILLLLTIVAFAAPHAKAERLEPSQIEHRGSFRAPVRQGEDRWQKWDYGLAGMTYIADCMGKRDPSPNDGYPGCLGGYSNRSSNAGFSRFGVMDIVPPGRQATNVIGFYDLGDGVPQTKIGDTGQHNYFGVHYQKGKKRCRIWWSYGDGYATVRQDAPFLGYSSCDPRDPNPQGPWDFGKERSNAVLDPFHTAKMYRSITSIPKTAAGKWFKGRRMMLGTPRGGGGGNGGSAGPSLFIRPMRVPKAAPPGPVRDAKALVWYRWHGSYWYQPRDLPEWDVTAAAYAFEYLLIGNQEAVIVFWGRPTIQKDVYPYNQPNAYNGSVSEFPTKEVNTCWYGAAKCADTLVEELKPSFRERQSTGQHMPSDCKIVWDCGSGKGWHCNNRRAFFLLYDPRDLARAGKGSMRPWDVKPYAEESADWFDYGAPNGCSARFGGSAYDRKRQLLYVAQYGSTTQIHILAIRR